MKWTATECIKWIMRCLPSRPRSWAARPPSRPPRSATTTAATAGTSGTTPCPDSRLAQPKLASRALSEMSTLLRIITLKNVTLVPFCLIHLKDLNEEYMTKRNELVIQGSYTCSLTKLQDIFLKIPGSLNKEYQWIIIEIEEKISACLFIYV